MHRGGVYAYTHLTLNGASPVFADVRVRKAFAMAIDRARIVEALLGPLGVPPVPLNNHVYMTNHRAYQDNSGEVGKYQLERAKALLDEAGWRQGGGAVRTKDGKELVVRLVLLAGRAADKQVAELAQGMAREVGVDVRIETVPQQDYIRGVLQPGNFDVAQFSYFGQGSPIAYSRLVFSAPKQKPDGTQGVGLNYSRSGTAELDDLFTRATQELDSTKEEQLGNQIDAMVWELALNIPLFQRPDIVATKSTLANYGAFGYANLIFEDIGFIR